MTSMRRYESLGNVEDHPLTTNMGTFHAINVLAIQYDQARDEVQFLLGAGDVKRGVGIPRSIVPRQEPLSLVNRQNLAGHWIHEMQLLACDAGDCLIRLAIALRRVIGKKALHAKARIWAAVGERRHASRLRPKLATRKQLVG
jgi:hypothetical protein